MRAILSTAILALAASTMPALASGPGEKRHEGAAYLAGGALTYAVFEEAIAHVDLAACPAEFDPDAVFCRMTLAADRAHVFVFDHDGEQNLLAVKSYGLEDGFLPF